MSAPILWTLQGERADTHVWCSTKGRGFIFARFRTYRTFGVDFSEGGGKCRNFPSKDTHGNTIFVQNGTRNNARLLPLEREVLGFVSSLSVLFYLSSTPPALVMPGIIQTNGGISFPTTVLNAPSPLKGSLPTHHNHTRRRRRDTVDGVTSISQQTSIQKRKRYHRQNVYTLQCNQCLLLWPIFSVPVLYLGSPLSLGMIARFYGTHTFDCRD